MKIRHMRFVLPPRMRQSVQADARVIAEAAAQALRGHEPGRGPISVQVQGHGRPAKFVAQDVARVVAGQVRARNRRAS